MNSNQPDWATEYRLKLIRELAALSFNDDLEGDRRGLLVKIMFLCDMTDDFLDQNKGQYEDAIKSLNMGGVTVEL